MDISFSMLHRHSRASMRSAKKSSTTRRKAVMCRTLTNVRIRTTVDNGLSLPARQEQRAPAHPVEQP